MVAGSCVAYVRLHSETLLAILVGLSCVSIGLLLLSGIQKLVLAGRVGEAIEATQQLYPGLLEHNPNLLFMLK